MCDNVLQWDSQENSQLQKCFSFYDVSNEIMREKMCE